MRIASYNLETKQITQVYRTLREAGKAGYSLSRLSKCINGEAKSHKGLGWRRVGGVFGLDLFLEKRLRLAVHSSCSLSAIYSEFLNSLPVQERNISPELLERAIAIGPLGHFLRGAVIAAHELVADCSP